MRRWRIENSVLAAVAEAAQQPNEDRKKKKTGAQDLNSLCRIMHLLIACNAFCADKNSIESNDFAHQYA